MALKAQDDLLEYFHRELAYLRTQSADFAARFPNVAQRLLLTGSESPDPHTERLIEAVAFLTARVHRDLDREFPAVASGLLDNLCPSLTQPVPAMTVVQMLLDPTQGKVTAGSLVPRATSLQAVAASGEICRMRTAWDLTLWPLHVSEVKLEDPRTLSVHFGCVGGGDVAELELDVLRLHLFGDLLTTMSLHELLTTGLENVQVVTAEGAVFPLASRQLTPVGFDEGEEVLPKPPHAHPAYGLLQEYFAFPQKFQFFDISGLRGRLGKGQGFELRLVFNRTPRLLGQLNASNLLLGCVPVVNLFGQTSEPIRLDRLRHEYLLMPDLQHDSTTEVHSVLSVIASDPQTDRPTRIPSVYAEPEPDEPHVANIFYTTRREASLRRNVPGSDVFISFVDQGDVRFVAAEPVVFAKLLCTNRRLAEQLPIGSRMRGERVPQSTSIRTLYQPSAQREPVTGSRALWALVSLLRLNHRSLADGSTGAQTLRQMLMLFAGDAARDQAQVRGIKSLTAKPAVARLGPDTWRGLCRGMDITLEFDPQAFLGSSALVLAGVLSRFFALYTATNSFVRLSVRQGGELVMKWPAMSGGQCLI